LQVAVANAIDMLAGDQEALDALLGLIGIGLEHLIETLEGESLAQRRNAHLFMRALAKVSLLQQVDESPHLHQVGHGAAIGKLKAHVVLLGPGLPSRVIEPTPAHLAHPQQVGLADAQVHRAPITAGALHRLPG